jgi:hypothetical protein
MPIAAPPRRPTSRGRQHLASRDGGEAGLLQFVPVALAAGLLGWLPTAGLHKGGALSLGLQR